MGKVKQAESGFIRLAESIRFETFAELLMQKFWFFEKKLKLKFIFLVYKKGKKTNFFIKFSLTISGQGLEEH